MNIHLLLASFLLLSVNVFAQNQDKALEKKRKKFSKHYDGWAYIPQTEEEGISNFYMLKTEITNIQWKEYEYHTRKTKGESAIPPLLPDTLLWLSVAHGAPFVSTYYGHPAYWDYPVVNISYEQAEAYCQWLEDFLNGLEDKKFKSVKVRLPNNAEWSYAARGGHSKTSPYPWGTYSLKNEKGRDLANYYKVDQSKIAYDEVGKLIIRETPASSTVTSTSESYLPNNYGLYGMAGNVAEFVQDDHNEAEATQRILKGGSWADPGYYLQISVDQLCDAKKTASPKHGFRPIMFVEY